MSPRSTAKSSVISVPVMIACSQVDSVNHASEYLRRLCYLSRRSIGCSSMHAC